MAVRLDVVDGYEKCILWPQDVAITLLCVLVCGKQEPGPN